MICALVTGLVAGPGGAPALAGDYLVLQTVPETRSTVTEPIKVVRVSVNDPTYPEFSDIVVTGPDGRPCQEGPVRVWLDINFERTVRITVPGVHRVSWTAGRVKDDLSYGEFQFTVAGSAVVAPSVSTGSAPVAQTAGIGDPIQGRSTQRWLLLGLLIFLPLVVLTLPLRRRGR
ncbi:copper resistance protein CopC [Actinoplanes hulinensis]|uniref:Copper resistance protein CopC n=1 Tax=Actinoplanes hulinensis TaxID=1144547 RepID=A0ABS7BCS5_9ACTN|nr:copper resistance protein CopC [Actinoplanes hulinensis]MBW6438865.1 copper resistance protein CopC [Actinoplanes hulinensis]